MQEAPEKAPYPGIWIGEVCEAGAAATFRRAACAGGLME